MNSLDDSGDLNQYYTKLAESEFLNERKIANTKIQLVMRVFRSFLNSALLQKLRVASKDDKDKCDAIELASMISLDN